MAQREAKKNADLLRKLQNKLRKQRQDLQRTHEYDLQQKMKAQSLWYETEIKSLNEALDKELSIQKARYETELQEVQEELITKYDKTIADKDQQINGLVKDLDFQQQDFKKTNENLSFKLEKLEREKEDLKTQVFNIEKQKNKEIGEINAEALVIQNEATQWMTSQAANPKKADFQDIEEKLLSLNKQAKQFIDKRVREWKQANEEADEMVIELDDKQKIINNLEIELKHIKNEYDAKAHQLQNLENNYQDVLARDVNEYKIRMQNLHKEIENGAEQRQKLETEIADITDANNDLLRHIKVVERQNNEFDVQQNHSQHIIAELKEKMLKNEENSDQKQKHIMQLQMELQNVILEKKDVSRRLADKADQLIDYKTKITTMEAKNRKQIGALEEGLQNALNELRDKTRDCQRLRDRVDNITGNLQKGGRKLMTRKK